MRLPRPGVSAFLALLTAALLVVPVAAEEGMFPISALGRLNLEARGLQVPVSTIYNPGGASLVEAIVQIGGCTGSFVSASGLVLTNHHCAFGALQAASSPGHDYVTEGFLAPARAGEMPARGLAAQFAERTGMCRPTCSTR